MNIRKVHLLGKRKQLGCKGLNPYCLYQSDYKKFQVSRSRVLSVFFIYFYLFPSVQHSSWHEKSAQCILMDSHAEKK